MNERNDDMNQSLQPLISWLFCEPNPIAINTALMMTKAVKPVFRLPYLPLSTSQQQQGKQLISELPPGSYVGNAPVLLQSESIILC
jgi:4-hydroxy-tetrahydrodipicolinate synthase